MGIVDSDISVSADGFATGLKQTEQRPFAGLLVVGGARGTWRTRENRRQVFGVLLFAVIAVAVAVIGSALLAGALAILALLGHAAWDIWHHIRTAVVTRTYAEFCAVLDIALAVVIAVALVIDAGWVGLPTQ